MSDLPKPEAESMVVKVLISGAFASGKTTLCKCLRGCLDSMGLKVNLTSETPRSCPFALNKQQTVFASAWLMGEQIRAEVEASVGNVAVVICDRGIPDIFSHTRVLSLESHQEKVIFQVLKEIATAWSKTYDLILWAGSDPEREIVADEIRVTSKEYQNEMEISIQKTFSELKIKPIKLPSETEDRVIVSKKEIQKVLNKKQK